MTLILTAVSLNARPLTPALSARFDDHGGTIGRADHNTLALPDPDRLISRLQAEVVANGNRFLIRNVGSANAILVAGRALQGGQSTVIEHADVIRIGGYVLQADYQAPDSPERDAPNPALSASTPAPAPPELTRPRPVQPAALQAQAVTGLSPDNPFADLLGPGGSSGPSADPFADLFSPSAPSGSSPAARREPLPAYQPAPAGIDGRSPAVPPERAEPAYQRLPDDFDPFAAPPAPRQAASAEAAVDPFADLMASAPAAGIDDAFGLAGNREGDPLRDFESNLGKAPGATGSSALSTDPLVLFGAPAPPAPTHAPAQPDHVPALHAAYTPPVTSPPPAAPATPMPAPARPHPTPGSAASSTQPGPIPALSPANPPPALPGDEQAAQALWAAFCAGAGIDQALPPGSGPERMQTIGRLLRAAVDGTLQLMAVRASTKHELRAEVTVIQPRNNNPLKFSPDAASGIEQLLQPPARGFLDGPRALEEVMEDLVGHSIGTVAGMRAAIEGMLGRFDPAALEAKLAGGSMLDSLLPMNRRARLWDLYLQHHAGIREEAHEDFHTLFGRAFLAAYEQQVERLRLKKKQRP